VLIREIRVSSLHFTLHAPTLHGCRLQNLQLATFNLQLPSHHPSSIIHHPSIRFSSPNQKSKIKSPFASPS
jgi:hypothetical protein